MIEYVIKAPHAKKVLKVLFYGFLVSSIVRPLFDHLHLVANNPIEQGYYILFFFVGCVLLYSSWWHSRHKISDIAIKPWQSWWLLIVGISSICFFLLSVVAYSVASSELLPEFWSWIVFILVVVTGVITLLGMLFFVQPALSYLSNIASRAASFKRTVPDNTRPWNVRTVWLVLTQVLLFIVFLVLFCISSWTTLVMKNLSKDTINFFLGSALALVSLSGFFHYWPPQSDKADFKLRLTPADLLLVGAGLLMAAFSGARVLLIPQHVWFVGVAEQTINTIFVLLFWLLITFGVFWREWRRDQENVSEPEDKTTVAQ